MHHFEVVYPFAIRMGKHKLFFLFCLCFLQNFVDIEDFMKAQPDAIVHSAAKIISRVKSGGEKTTQALKSLCWRCKGIQVEVTQWSYINL